MAEDRLLRVRHWQARHENNRSRELKRTDAEIHAAVGTAPRTLCNARKRLAEYKLIQYHSTAGNKFVYVICDPVTGLPYPADARQPLICRKRAATPSDEPPAPIKVNGDDHQPKVPGATEEKPLESYGLPGVFQ